MPFGFPSEKAFSFAGIPTSLARHPRMAKILMRLGCSTSADHRAARDNKLLWPEVDKEQCR